MGPRGQAAGNGEGSSRAFRIDVRFGHAWFARSERARLPAQRGPELLPALRRAELILASQGRAIARRATRIPTDAIVALGAALSPPVRAMPLAAPAGASLPSDTSGANDNAAKVVRNKKALLREIVFLLIFGATLAGTYYLGRLHAFYKVIEVPEPRSGGSVV